MKLLVDINIILDVVLGRSPWGEEAATLLSWIEEGRVDGWVAAHTITTTHYIVAKEKGKQAAGNAVADLLRVLRVVPLGDTDFQQALILGVDDFEDAVQAAAGLKIGADYLVTRNAKDFRGISIPLRRAGEVLPLI